VSQSENSAHQTTSGHYEVVLQESGRLIGAIVAYQIVVAVGRMQLADKVKEMYVKVKVGTLARCLRWSIA